MRTNLILLAAAAVALTVGARAQRDSATKPVSSSRLNVVLIAVDDLNTDLGAFGHSVVRTPHIDRLMARGVRFDRAYCQFPLCSPSRESFLSGLRPESSGAIAQDFMVRDLRRDAPYLPTYFRARGYHTASAGKIFHRNEPAAWDKYDAGSPTSPQEQKAGRARSAARAQGNNGPEWYPIDDPDEQLGDTVVASQAIAMLRVAAKGKKPFFVAAGFRKPHLPWTAPKRFFDLYPQTIIPRRNEPAMTGIPPIALQTDLFGTPNPDPEWQAVAGYYACISYIDEQVGRITAALDELQLWDNTVVIFVSDHGFHLGDHGGLWAKLTTFERSARVPLAIVPPRSPHAGRATRGIVELVDLYPTLVELCQLPMPTGLEGRSLVPLLSNPEARWEKPAYTMTIHEGVIGRSVRTTRWRYTEWDGRGVELYDHESDPGEYRNLATEATFTGEVSELQRLLRQPPRFSGRVPFDAQSPRTPGGKRGEAK